MNEETKDFAFELVLLRTELETARKVIAAARAVVTSGDIPTDSELAALRSEIAIYDVIVAKQQPSGAPSDSTGETSNG